MSKRLSISDGTRDETRQHHSYLLSPEIEEVIRRLYQENSEEFFSRTVGPNPLNINTDYQESQLGDESDFRLRQLIRFFRPIPSLYAFVQSVGKWKEIRKAVEGFDDSKLVPWVSLVDTANVVQRAIESYMREEDKEEEGRLFEGYDIQPKHLVAEGMYTPQDLEDSKGLVNPLLHIGAGTSPLNALILNDPSRDQDGNSPNKLLYARLAGYVIIREEERRKPVGPYPKFEPEESGLWTEWRFNDPYRFMNYRIDQAPGRSKLAEVDRIIRNWSRQWEDSFMPVRMEELLRLSSYSAFIGECHEELKILLTSKEADRKFISLLQFFVKPRIVRRGGGGGGGGSKKRSPINPGRHYWQEVQEVPEIEESIYGHEIEVNDILTELSDEEFEVFEAAGEDPCEEDQDRTRYKVLFGENVRAAKLELEQHERFQQRLLASLNQQLYWDRQGCTRAEIEELIYFLKRKRASKEGGAIAEKATLMLEVLVILGVDLDMALQIELGPDQDERWLSGISRFAMGDTMDDLEPKTPKTHRPKLRICRAQFKGDEIFVWNFPIPVRSLAKHANTQSSKNYQHHSSRIAFRDLSGVVKELIRFFPRRKKANSSSKSKFQSTLLPLCLESERLEVKQECYRLLKEFNGEVNAIDANSEASELYRQEGMRKITFAKIRQFSRNILIRSGMEMTYVDALDWQSPKDHRSALFYYTRDAFQLAQIAKENARQGLQYSLSERTGIFVKTRMNNRGMPPTRYLIFGAAGLLKPEYLFDRIADIKERLHHRPLVVSDRVQMGRFIEWFNLYSFYTSLWFCFETTHRPHHIPYVKTDGIDRIFGFLNLHDKTNPEGDKNRVARVSRSLLEHMLEYEALLGKVRQWAMENHLSWPDSPLVYIQEMEIVARGRVLKQKKTIKIVPFTGSILGELIRKELDAEPNFYRKLISYSLRKQDIPQSKRKKRLANPSGSDDSGDALEVIVLDKHPFSPLEAVAQTDVQIALGHFNHGTSPFHQFGTTSHLEHASRIEGKLGDVIASFGFIHLPLRPLTFKFTLQKKNTEGQT